MIEQPTIRTADTDSNGIVKRRRRPALSCVECRVRKVKCDRRRPCGACTKINSTTCTYRPHPPGIRSQSEQPLRDDTSADYAKDSESWSSARSSPQAVAPPTEFDALINRYVAPGVFGEHDKLKLLPADRPCFNLSTHSDRTQDSTISALLGRIHSLEKKLASTLNDQAGYPTSVGESPRWRNGHSAEPEPHGQSYDISAINSHDAPGATHTATGYDTQRKEVNKPTELHSTVSEIKRITKRTRIPQSSISSELRSCIPPKELCDKLVDCYLRTFEGVFRVLHVPSFKKAYHSHWLGTAPDKPSFIHTLLLVCAIAVPFYVGPEKAKLCQSARKWLQAAVDWQGAPHAESRLNMVGLQIQILILIARQACNVDGDYSWIPAGTLLRTAMHLGLHRDPSHFPKITVYHGEMRRRLWATVLEIAAQSSLDMGMPPMISVNDYDTKPPSNINDEDMGDGMDTPLDIKPATTYTDSSIQIAFTQTLPTRLEIIRLINNLRFDLPYDDILRIGTKLLDTCYEKTIFFKSALDSGYSITPFQIKMLDTLVRRFILCLHRPYFSKANKNPRYHYSRKICLDTSLAICAPATELASGEEDDWTRMSHRCVGIFKTFFLYSLSTIYYELISQINESQKEASLFTPLISTSTRATTSSSQRLQSLPAQYHLLREILESAQVTALTRIRNGEKNAKGIFFLKCALARIDALASGANPEAAVLDAAKNSAIVVSKVLAVVYREEHGEDIDLSATSSGPNKEKDDYQVNNSPSNTAGHNDSRMAVGNSNADAQSGFEDPFSIFDSTIEGLDTMLSAPDLSDLGAGMDIDLNACMQGQVMDTGNNMLHFGRSPEWFYNVDRWAAAGNFGNVGGFGYEV